MRWRTAGRCTDERQRYRDVEPGRIRSPARSSGGCGRPATIIAAEAREAALGKAAARASYLPFELVERLDAGEHPIRVWRKHRGLTRQALAAAACIAPSYVTEIETRKKRGKPPQAGRRARRAARRDRRLDAGGIAATIGPRASGPHAASRRSCASPDGDSASYACARAGTAAVGRAVTGRAGISRPCPSRVRGRSRGLWGLR